ncbi:MAG: helix-turn-helix domain-containing protein [Chitinophagales bacterium]
MNKYHQAKNLEELLQIEYGKRGTEKREVFEARSKAFYFCEMLKEKRKEAKLSQKLLAEKADVKPSFLSRVENGKVDIQLSTLIKILNGMGMSLQIIKNEAGQDMFVSVS